MNRLIGFFKDKISEVKEENKQELQALANALTQNQYSSDRVIAILQSMKSNYMNWNILIANQASTGLYYSQMHNRNICLRKIKGNKDLKKHLEKNKLKLGHIKETAQELKEITQLNGKWVNNVNKEIEGINKYLNYVESLNKINKNQQKPEPTKEEETKKEQEQVINLQNVNSQQNETKPEHEIEQNEKKVKVEEIVDDEN